MNRWELNISKIELCDYNSIVNICDECFGKGFISKYKISTPSHQNNVQLKAIINHTNVGFCQVIVDEKEQLIQKYKGINFTESKAYILQTLAIHPKYQRQGFGSKLVAHLLEKLKNSDPNFLMLYPSWNEPKSQAFCTSLIKLGFKELKTYPNFWYNDSIKNCYTCISCGEPPCNCSMKLMILK